MADKVSQVRTFDGVVHDIEDTSLTSEVDSLSTTISSEVDSLLSQMSELSSEITSTSTAQSEVDRTQDSTLASMSTAQSEVDSTQNSTLASMSTAQSEADSTLASMSTAQSEVDSTQNSTLASMSSAQSEADSTQNSEIASLSTAESELGSEITRFESEVASDYIQIGDVDTDKGLYATSTSAYVKVDGTTIDYNSSGELGVVKSYRKVVLYTNTSLSTYAAQTVTLSDSTANYDAIFVRYQTTPGNADSVITEVIADGVVRNQLIAPEGAESNGTRTVVLVGTSASFGEGYATGAVNNASTIPIEIYGVHY